jgi:hypothetical protein
VIAISWPIAASNERRRRPPRHDERRHRPFEELEHAVEHGIVASVLDDAAGMRHRGAVAAEHEADLSEAQAAGNVREVHGDLARKRNRRLAPRRTEELGIPDTEHLRDGGLDRRPEAPTALDSVLASRIPKTSAGAARDA